MKPFALSLALSILGAGLCLANTLPSQSPRLSGRAPEVIRAFEDVETTGSIAEAPETLGPVLVERDRPRSPCSTRTWFVDPGRFVRVHSC